MNGILTQKFAGVYGGSGYMCGLAITDSNTFVAVNPDEAVRFTTPFNVGIADVDFISCTVFPNPAADRLTIATSLYGLSYPSLT